MAYTPASSDFPLTKTSFVSPEAGSDTGDFDHAGLESAQNSAISRLEDEVGITGSADTSSINYKLDHITVADITDVTASAAEINYTDGVTSAIQTQLNTKASLTGTEELTNKTLTSPKINEAVALTSTATELNLLHGKLGAWTSFNPSWTNITVGAGGTNTGFYAQIGKTVHFRTYFKFGTGSAVGAAILTLPVTIATYTDTTSIIGRCTITDAGTAVYFGSIYASGDVKVSKADGTYVLPAALSSTVPMTWTTNDTLSITGTYEAA